MTEHPELDDVLRETLHALGDEAGPGPRLSSATVLAKAAGRKRARATGLVAAVAAVIAVGGGLAAVLPARDSGPAVVVPVAESVAVPLPGAAPDESLTINRAALQGPVVLGSYRVRTPGGPVAFFRDPRTGIFSNPGWVTAVNSPDGQRVAFQRSLTSDTIGIRDATGTTQHITLPFIADGVGWSRDGARLLATTYDGDGRRHGFVIIDPSTGQFTQAAVPNPTGMAQVSHGDDQFRWSNDSHRVVATTPGADGQLDVSIFDLAGRRQQTLRGAGPLAMAPADPISPSGQALISADSTGIPRILRIADGTVITTLPADFGAIDGWYTDQQLIVSTTVNNRTQLRTAWPGTPTGTVLATAVTTARIDFFFHTND